MPDSGSNHRLTAFTIIELLVVVSIIVLLIAILLPSMKHARESARIAKCTAHLHQIGAGLAAYATGSKLQYPEGNASSWRGLGIDATWFRNNGATWPIYRPSGKGQPMGLAFLIMNDYTPDARLYYCPSWTHPYHDYDVTDTQGLDGAGGPNKYGGWPAPGNPGPTTYRGISYNYRTTFGVDPLNVSRHAPGGTAPTLKTPGVHAIVADHWTTRFVTWAPYAHTKGYPTLYLDGHAQFNIDPDNRYMIENNPVFSHDSWGIQERLWQDFFDRGGSTAHRQ